MAKAWEENNLELARTLEKNRNVVGIMIADVSGKMTTDHSIAFYLDAVFRTIVALNLRYLGEVKADSIELINTIIYNLLNGEHLPVRKYVTMLYGEFSGNGTIRYIPAGHPVPEVFSRRDNRIVELDDNCTHSSTPLGMQPSEYVADLRHFDPVGRTKKKSVVNTITLKGIGDIAVLYSDGLSETSDGRNFVKDKLESVLQNAQDESARGIYDAIKHARHKYAPIEDDMTIAVVKKL